jgi:hypothetical protein
MNSWFVTRAEFDEERRLRLEAEKARDVAIQAAQKEAGIALERLATIEHYRKTAEAAQAQLQLERESSERQLQAVLTHTVPIKKEHEFSPDDPALAEMTPEEIMLQPVSTRQGMFLRKAAADAAALRKMSADERRAHDKRREMIQTPEEIAANRVDFDPMLGINISAADKVDESESEHAN